MTTSFVADLTDACIAANGRDISFDVMSRGRAVHCVIDRDILAQHFWLPGDADEARTLKVLLDAKARVIAVAERRALKALRKTIELRAHDFELGLQSVAKK